jgi:acyl carrier protein
MNSMLSMVDATNSDVIHTISETICTISPKAREVNVTAHSRLLEELALDSLDLVAVVIRLQDIYDVEIDPDELTNITRVGDLVRVLVRQVRSAA